MISAFAFVGAFLEGENTPYLTPDFPWFSQKYDPQRMQAVASPAKWGIGSVWLSMFKGDGSGWRRETWYAAMRSLQGYACLHDLGEQWNYLNWRPFDPSRPMTFYPYWDPAALGLQVPGGQTASATDLKGWQCKTELPMTGQPEGAAGTLTLTVPPHDYRMILIAPADGAK